MTGSAQPFLQTQWYGEQGESILLKGQIVKRVFSPFCIRTKNNLLNRQAHIIANCLMLMGSSWDLEDLPSNQILPESDSGMLTLMSDCQAGDYSGVLDWPPWLELLHCV